LNSKFPPQFYGDYKALKTDIGHTTKRYIEHSYCIAAYFSSHHWCIPHVTSKSAPADRRLPILGFSVADGRGAKGFGGILRGDAQLGDISILKTLGFPGLE